MKEITFGSLFAGIGGFDLGYHQAGMRCAWQAEIDPAARSVLAHHWPKTPRFADVRDCGAQNLEYVDVMSFGFPCQDLSVAGNRAGLAGARSGLFYEATRIANELRPMLLTWENVPGLLSSNSGRDFAAVLMELERIGYVGGWTTLDAQWFGVAQRRQRVFGVFARADLGAAVCAEILSLATRMPGHSETGRAARADVARGITASAGHHGRSSPRGDGSDNLISFNMHSYGQDAASVGETLAADHGVGIVGADCIANTISAHHGRNSGEDTFVAATLGASFGRNRGLGQENEIDTLVCGAQRSARGQAGHIIPIDMRQASRGSKMTNNRAPGSSGGAPGTGIGDVGDPSPTLADSHTPAVLAFTERTRAEGRTLEVQDDLAYALTNPGSSGRTHSRQIAGGFGVRRLTPTECERLQGFPDGWTAVGADGPQSDSARYRQLGNAVAVVVSRWLGHRIVAALESF